jgi:hypothetical protein
MGDISGPGGLSYDTGRQYGHDDNKAVEMLERGRTEGAVAKLTGRSAAIAGGDPTALAAAANKYTLSSQTERTGGSSGGSKRGGYSYGSNVSSTYIGPPKAAKASPCFVVNKKSEAVPVFIVNSKDIQGVKGGSPTANDVAKVKEDAIKKAAAKEPASVKDEKKFIGSICIRICYIIVGWM